MKNQGKNNTETELKKEKDIFHTKVDRQFFIIKMRNTNKGFKINICLY